MTKKSKKKPADQGGGIKTDFGDAPPVIYTMTNDQYHGSSGVSRSDLWTIHTKTPFHMRYGKRDPSKPMQLGAATGCAILEPDDFESRYVRTELTRAGTNDWKDAEAEAKANGAELLKAAEFDKCLAMREAAHAYSAFRKLVKGAKFEEAGYWIDPETGVLCKCKPDICNPGIKIIGDLKTAASASYEEFGRSIVRYGYHVQEAYYTDGWKNLGACDGFVFAVIESEPPHAVAMWELPPAANREGRAIYRNALGIYAECLQKDEWPGYPDKVMPIDIPRYGYSMTRPDDGEG